MSGAAMDFKPLPFDASLAGYERQADELLTAYRAGDDEAKQLFKERLPLFQRPDVPWLTTADADVRMVAASLDQRDARMAVARWYDFRDWSALEAHVEAVARLDSPVHRFEGAVEAVVGGDVDALRRTLRRFPDLVAVRSQRVTHFDPPVHRATLLHYVAANGVEGYRQKTPPNVVSVARLLLESGADVDALADLYGEGCTTLSLLVSSCHPAEAGLQAALADLLLDFGASIEGDGSGKWSSPLMTALAFGYTKAAEALAARGARTDSLPAAAGLGRPAEAQKLLPGADAESRHKALALAVQHGHANVVALLLDAGEDPNRFNPKGNHAHSTPLHQAALAGHAEVVRLLVERGARLDTMDTTYQSTPLGWATHGGQHAIAQYLRSCETRGPTRTAS